MEQKHKINGFTVRWSITIIILVIGFLLTWYLNPIKTDVTKIMAVEIPRIDDQYHENKEDIIKLKMQFEYIKKELEEIKELIKEKY